MGSYKKCSQFLQQYIQSYQYTNTVSVSSYKNPGINMIQSHTYLNFSEGEPYFPYCGELLKTNCQQSIEEIRSRSFKNWKLDQQLSFQLNFYQEHLQTFTNQFYKCFTLQHQQKVFNLLNENDFFNTNQNNYQQISVCILNNSILNYQQQKQFCKDLQKQQKLIGFLQQIQSITPNLIYQQLLYITFLAWEQYLIIKQKSSDDSHFKESARKAGSNLKIKGMFVNKIPQMASSSTSSQQLNSFLVYYIETILLVIESFFKNPHMPQNHFRPTDSMLFNFQG